MTFTVRSHRDSVVLSGVSAGSICWYEGGCTDAFGPELRAVTNGLGLLPYGSGVHYDSEDDRTDEVRFSAAPGSQHAGPPTPTRLEGRD